MQLLCVAVNLSCRNGFLSLSPSLSLILSLFLSHSVSHTHARTLSLCQEGYVTRWGIEGPGEDDGSFTLVKHLERIEDSEVAPVEPLDVSLW